MKEEIEEIVGLVRGPPSGYAVISTDNIDVLSAAIAQLAPDITQFILRNSKLDSTKAMLAAIERGPPLIIVTNAETDDDTEIFQTANIPTTATVHFLTIDTDQPPDYRHVVCFGIPFADAQAIMKRTEELTFPPHIDRMEIVAWTYVADKLAPRFVKMLSEASWKIVKYEMNEDNMNVPILVSLAFADVEDATLLALARTPEKILSIF